MQPREDIQAPKYDKVTEESLLITEFFTGMLFGALIMMIFYPFILSFVLN